MCEVLLCDFVGMNKMLMSEYIDFVVDCLLVCFVLISIMEGFIFLMLLLYFIVFYFVYFFVNVVGVVWVFKEV